MIFSKYTELCSHHPNLILDNVSKILHAHLQTFPVSSIQWSGSVLKNIWSSEIAISFVYKNQIRKTIVFIYVPASTLEAVRKCELFWKTRIIIFWVTTFIGTWSINTCERHPLVHISYKVQENCRWVKLVGVFLVIIRVEEARRFKWTNFHQHYNFVPGLVCSRAYD